MAHDNDDYGYGRRGGEEPQGGPLHDRSGPGPKGYESQNFDPARPAGSSASNWGPASQGQTDRRGFVEPGQGSRNAHGGAGNWNAGWPGGFGPGQGGTGQPTSRPDHPQSMGEAMHPAADPHANDHDYRAWRDKEMARHDADYAEFKKHRQDRFAQEFEDWRKGRTVGGGLTPVSGSADTANERTAPGIGGENKGVDTKTF